MRAAVLAELAGADGITVHLREDRRHIQDRDVRLLMQTVRTGVNLELAAASDVLDIACELHPMTATLVPERREEITTEGGLALDGSSGTRVAEAVRRLHEAGIRTSLFIAPDRDVIDAAAQLGVEAIELHTGEFAEAYGTVHTQDGRAALAHEVTRLRRAASYAHALGIAVHAGHGLTYENVAHVAGIGEIEELNIGHSIVSRAVLVGMERAVREMRDIIGAARRTALHGD